MNATEQRELSLATIATRTCRLLGGATAPVYLAAAVLVHGPARW